MDACGRRSIDGRNQALIEFFRGERQNRRDQLAHRDQYFVERLDGRLLVRVIAALPEPPPAPADVPGGQHVDEPLGFACHARRIEVVQPVVAESDQLIEPGKHPPVEFAAARNRSGGRNGRAVRQIGVGHEESVYVPQPEHFPHDLFGGSVAEPEDHVQRRAGVLPSHHVGAHAGGGVLHGDRVIAALAEGFPVLVPHFFVSEYRLERGPVVQGHRHEQLGIEPQPDLFAHFRDPVSGKPGFPGSIRAVAGIPVLVPLGFGPPFRPDRAFDPAVLRQVVQRRKRDDTRVEPAVPDLGHPLYSLSATLAGNLDFIDPRTMEFGQRFDQRGIHGPLPQFGRAADDVHVIAVPAMVEGQGQPPETAARYAPVPHVVQPVLHQEAAVFGYPPDRCGGLLHRRPDLVR